MGVAGCMCRRAWGSRRHATWYFVFLSQRADCAHAGTRELRLHRQTGEPQRSGKWTGRDASVDGGNRGLAPATPRIQNPESTCLHRPVR